MCCPVQAILWRIHKVDVPKLGTSVLHVSRSGARGLVLTWVYALALFTPGNPKT